MILRTENGNHYLTKIRANEYVAVKVRYVTGVELMRLKRGKKVWKTGNIELRDSLPLLIYSPSSQRYWYRILRHGHDLSNYRKYIRDGNLYIYFNKEWIDFVKKERDSEGMSYNDYNGVRELILLREICERREDSAETKIKLRAIQIEIDKIKNK